MKNKKLLAVALIAIVAGAALAWAVGEYILSETVTVDVYDYILSLSVTPTSCMVGETVTFSGTLMLNSNPVPDVEVRLCQGIPETGFYTGLSDITDANGYYEIPYTTTATGTFSFYTNATRP